MGVDVLDVKILKDLIQRRATAPLDPQFRKSFTDIAQKLGVDSDTVRNRVRKLQQARLLGDWHIVVNPHLLGGDDVAIWLDVQPATKDGLIDKIKVMQGVSIITIFLGSRLMFFLRHDSQRFFETQLELVRRISKAPHLDFAKLPFPECTLKLSRTDWTVLRALHTSPRKTYAAISKEVGLSIRTVKRRLDRLIQGGVAFALPEVSPKALQGAVMAALEVAYPPDRKGEIDAKIDNHFGDHVWHVLHLLPGQQGTTQHCFFSMVIWNLSKAKAILHKVELLPGVQSARMHLYEDMIFLFDSFDEYLGRKLGQMPFA